jgi:DNA repair protein RadC
MVTKRRPTMINYSEYEQEAINVAVEAIRSRLVNGDIMGSPTYVGNFLKMKLAHEPEEWFAVMFLTNQQQLISFQRLFRGTINASSVHIRVIARKALELNAAALVLAHNHPSGVSEPSGADMKITRDIKDALQVFDIKVLDHFIVTTDSVCSFAERGDI